MLPTIKSPTFSIKTKEIKKSISVRPMVVAEHKALQQVNDIGSDLDLMITIGDIVASCTDGVITTKSSERYLLDYLFLQIYMTSVDDVITTRYTCRKEQLDEEGKVKLDEETQDALICNTSFDFKIPLTQAIINYPKEYEDNKVVVLDENTSLTLKAMSLDANIEIETLRANIDIYADELQSLLLDENIDDAENKLIIESNKKRIDELKKLIDGVSDDIRNTIIYRSVDYISDDGKILKAEADFNKEDFVKWLGNVPSKLTRGMDEFITNQPYIGMNAEIKCPKCGYTKTIDMRGLRDFFS